VASVLAPVPVLLDKAAVQLGPWSGYNVLAQHYQTMGFETGQG